MDVVLRRLYQGMLCAALALVGAGGAVAAPVIGPPYLVGYEFPVGSVSDLAVDAAGNAYVAGVVTQHDFPGIATTAYTNGGIDSRFVARFGPNARVPTFVVLVGSQSKVRKAARLDTSFLRDEVRGMALDAAGNVYLPAYESQTDYVATGGTHRTETGSKYIYKVSPAGLVSRHSIALDPAILRVAAVALDASGALYLTGSATNGLPTSPGAPYPTASVAAGCIVPFAMKLATSGQSVAYATYLANAVAPCAPIVSYVDPTGLAIAVDSASNAYITGQAEPGLSATPGALDLGTKTPAYFYPYGNTASHAFVTRLGPTGGLIYAARIGGALRDRGTGIVLDSAGNAIVAGKTSSHDFPVVGSASASYPFVLRDCLTFNPEVGFLSKVSPNGSQLVFSTYVPLDGGQLDDCGARFGGTLAWQPARVALDTTGNIVVAGFTSADNRDLPSTGDAIIPRPVDITHGVGNQLLQVFAPDGRLLHSTPLGMHGVQGIGLDARSALTIASGGHLQRLVPGSLPVDIALAPNPACAGQPATIGATVAGAFDLGTVEFTSDAAVLGSAPVSSGVSSFTTTFPSAGVRTLRAKYRGPGPFDRQSSIALHAVVNQAGACP